MNWLLIVYLLVLVYFVSREKLGETDSLRLAWIWFALIPISHFVFAMIRVSNSRSPSDLALTGVWEDGIDWLLLGISMFAGVQARCGIEEGGAAARSPIDIKPRRFGMRMCFHRGRQGACATNV